MELSGALTIVLPWQFGVNTRSLLYICKKGHEGKESRLQWKTAVVLPMSSPCRVGPKFVWICLTKSLKDPAIPRAWGPWLQMTSA